MCRRWPATLAGRLTPAPRTLTATKPWMSETCRSLRQTSGSRAPLRGSDFVPHKLHLQGGIELPMVLMTRLRRTPAIVWALALGIGCLLLATAPGSASSGTVIQVGTATVPAGQNASTNVIASIASNDSVNGFDVTLAFDPAVVTAASVTLSQGWTALPVASPIDNAGGTVRVAGFQLGTGCGSGSSCPLFAVSWHGVAGGSSTVRVSVQQLAGSNGGAAGTLSSVAA